MTSFTRTYADLRNHLKVSAEKLQLGVENEMRNLEAKMAQEHDAAKRHSQADEIATRREVLTALPTLERVIPTFTFEQHLTLHGSKRAVEVLTYGGGHTVSDAFLYLPDDQVLFLGDLLFVRTYPAIAPGDPEVWEHMLQRFAQLSFTVAVPGHGSLGGRADLEFNRQYLTAIVARAEEGMRKHMPLEEATQTRLPAPFDRWEGAEVFDWNMEFLYSRQK